MCDIPALAAVIYIAVVSIVSYIAGAVIGVSLYKTKNKGVK